MKRSRLSSIHKKVLSLIGAQAIVLSATLSWAEGASNHVRDVKVRTTDASTGAAEIEVVGTTAPVFNVRVENGGKRLRVDISNADTTSAKDLVTQPTGIVGGVLTQAFKNDAGNITRLAISLTKQATYRVRADGNSLKVTLTPSQGTVAAVGGKEESGKTLEDVKFERVKGIGFGPRGSPAATAIDAEPLTAAPLLVVDSPMS